MPTSGDENQPNMLTVPNGAIVVQFSVKNAKTLFTVLKKTQKKRWGRHTVIILALTGNRCVNLSLWKQIWWDVNVNKINVISANSVQDSWDKRGFEKLYCV